MTPARMARTYRRASKGRSADLSWVLELTADQRLHFRERGHLLAAQLLRYLDEPDPPSAHHHLDEALRTANEYGRVASSLGLSLSQTVEGFLRFRAPFHAELAAAARRRGFDTEDTTELLETAERAMDRLLLATMSGHDSPPRVPTGPRRPRPTRRPDA